MAGQDSRDPHLQLLRPAWSLYVLQGCHIKQQWCRLEPESVLQGPCVCVVFFSDCAHKEILWKGGREHLGKKWQHLVVVKEKFCWGGWGQFSLPLAQHRKAGERYFIGLITVKLSRLLVQFQTSKYAKQEPMVPEGRLKFQPTVTSGQLPSIVFELVNLHNWQALVGGGLLVPMLSDPVSSYSVPA